MDGSVIILSRRAEASKTSRSRVIAMPPINQRLVCAALEEAAEHSRSAIAELEKGSTTALDTWAPYIYVDLNRAWNARYFSDQEFKQAGDEIDGFPTDIDFT
jgi:hypothetical protein